MQEYDKTARLLHWGLAFLILSLLVLGFFMGEIPKPSALRTNAYNLHKSLGLTVLLLMLIRIIWRSNKKPPPFLIKIPRWQQIFAHIVHGFLYLLGIIMPLSGWIMSVAAKHVPVWFGLFAISLPITASKPLAKLAHNWHYWSAWSLIALITIHILAAFSHGIGENGVIWRMWSKKRHNNEAR